MLMSFPLVTEMFQFTRFASSTQKRKIPLKRVGFPIRKSTDQSLFAAPRGLSQRTTSFIASCRQGIHQMLLRHLIALITHHLQKSRLTAARAGYGNRSLQWMTKISRPVMRFPADGAVNTVKKPSAIPPHKRRSIKAGETPTQQGCTESISIRICPARQHRCNRQRRAVSPAMHRPGWGID